MTEGDDETCAHCGGHVDAMNTEAIQRGWYLWCSEGCLRLWAARQGSQS